MLGKGNRPGLEGVGEAKWEEEEEGQEHVILQNLATMEKGAKELRSMPSSQ